MIEKVFMGPNGNLCVGIPLTFQDGALTDGPYEVRISNAYKPTIAYILDLGEETCTIIPSEVDEQLVDLGEL